MYFYTSVITFNIRKYLLQLSDWHLRDFLPDMIFLKIESGSVLYHQHKGDGVRHIPATLVNILIHAKLSYIYNINIFDGPTYRVYMILNFYMSIMMSGAITQI